MDADLSDSEFSDNADRVDEDDILINPLPNTRLTIDVSLIYIYFIYFCFLIQNFICNGHYFDFVNAWSFAGDSCS